MNRQQKQQQSEPEEPTRGAGDYFVVSGDCGVWYISTEMARFVEASLDAVPPARWVKFVDLTGARVCLRTREIGCVYQSTAGQREAERAFGRALNQERKADRSWDEDD
jgi:hypothetical protein